jgi:hypothetical protein
VLRWKGANLVSHTSYLTQGRLLRRRDNEDGATTQLLPAHFDAMSRIYALGRFVRTLDEPAILNDNAVCGAIASTMKVLPEQVDAIVHASISGPLNSEVCTNILQIIRTVPSTQRTTSEDLGLTPETMGILGMLGLFLNRDRKSLRDFSNISYCSFDNQRYSTAKALVDCAMYCGSIRWLSEDDDEAEGLWTCLPCLHRWQTRGAMEAYQPRKLMHPMTLSPFTRVEYYDGEEWDSVMRATNGSISRLGVDFYWGRCSNEGCGSVCPAVARSGACAETDGVPLADFDEMLVLNDGENTIQLRRSLEVLGPLGPNNLVTTDSLEKYFDSEEKLMYVVGTLRRRVRNCIDKSTYILPP